MKREIKFRAYCPKDKKVYKSFEPFSQKFQEQSISGTIKPFPKDYIFMQYTELKDKNGVEVYEGDIVSFGYYDIGIPEMVRSIGVVEYDSKHLCYKLSKKINVPFYEGLRDIEVLGNIYQNTELIK